MTALSDVLTLVEAAKILDQWAYIAGGDHYEGPAIEAINAAHYAAMEYLGIDIDDEATYDPDQYLLKATTPEQCKWIVDRVWLPRGLGS